MTQETISQKPPKTFATPFADSGDKNTIPDTGVDAVNIQQGFPSIFSTPRANSGKSVARRDMNGILNSLSSLNYYFQYMGRNPWVSGTSYPKGAKVWYDNTEWISPYDNNTTAPGGQNDDGDDAWIAINDLGGTVGGGEDGISTTLTEILNAIAELKSELENEIDQISITGNSSSEYFMINWLKVSVAAGSATAGYTLTSYGRVVPKASGLNIRLGSSTGDVLMINSQTVPTPVLPPGTYLYGAECDVYYDPSTFSATMTSGGSFTGSQLSDDYIPAKNYMSRSPGKSDPSVFSIPTSGSMYLIKVTATGVGNYTVATTNPSTGKYAYRAILKTTGKINSPATSSVNIPGIAGGSVYISTKVETSTASQYTSSSSSLTGSIEYLLIQS